MATTPADAYRPMQAGRGEQDAAAVMAVIVASAGARCKANVAVSLGGGTISDVADPAEARP